MRDRGFLFYMFRVCVRGAGALFGGGKYLFCNFTNRDIVRDIFIFNVGVEK